jgi:glyoxylate reductase
VRELDDLFRDSDVISLHVAAGPQTRHLVNARRLALLPKHAILVNTSRGILVDDEALVSVLRGRRIAGAGLDVFEGEPDIHPGYLALPNVFLLPHIGSATVEAREAMGYRVLANLAAFFSGDEPPDRLNDRDGFNP